MERKRKLRAFYIVWIHSWRNPYTDRVTALIWLLLIHGVVLGRTIIPVEQIQYFFLFWITSHIWDHSYSVCLLKYKLAEQLIDPLYKSDNTLIHKHVEMKERYQCACKIWCCMHYLYWCVNGILLFTSFCCCNLVRLCTTSKKEQQHGNVFSCELFCYSLSK